MLTKRLESEYNYRLSCRRIWYLPLYHPRFALSGGTQKSVPFPFVNSCHPEIRHNKRLESCPECSTASFQRVYGKFASESRGFWGPESFTSLHPTLCSFKIFREIVVKNPWSAFFFLTPGGDAVLVRMALSKGS